MATVTERAPEHHGLMIPQVLAHIDFLDESVETLSGRVEELIAPLSQQVQLLCTIRAWPSAPLRRSSPRSVWT